MKPPLIQIFMMQPPKRKCDDDEEKDNVLANMLKMSVEMSGKMSEMTRSVKNLPHAEHSGGG
jgi:hypothetical protein